MFFDVPREVILFVFLIDVAVACNQMGGIGFDGGLVSGVGLKVLAFLSAKICLTKHTQFGIELVGYAAADEGFIPRSRFLNVEFIRQCIGMYVKIGLGFGVMDA